MKRAEFFKKLFSIPFITGAFFVLKKNRNEMPILIKEQLPVAGYAYYEGEKVISKIDEASKLRLVSEPENPYDHFAVEIYYKQAKLGYIPRYDNEVISRFLQQGKKVTATVKQINERGSIWEKIHVDVWLEE